MSRFNEFLTSSIGKKFLVTITGLFLSLFLVIHLIGNLQLLIPDEGEAFLSYVHVMESNILIKVVAFVLYFAILLHAYKGIMIWVGNRKARGAIRYGVKSSSGTSWASRNMALLGSILFIFIGIHMANFWYAYKFGSLEGVEPYEMIITSFSQPVVVVFYVLAQVALAFHLLHGFQSAFQTIGWRYGKYTGLIRSIGAGFAILIPLLFAVIPICVYFDIYPLFDFRVFPGQ